MQHFSPILTVMGRAIDKAGRALIRDFGEIEKLQVSRKGPSDFVTHADKRAETILREELSKARPRFGFLMEESGAVEGADGEHRFIIDPLDGTMNFLHGLPHWCISVGLEKGNEIVAGMIYDPVRDELFWAEKGAGAFCNKQRLRVSNRRSAEDCLVGTGLPGKGRARLGDDIATLDRVSSQTAAVRMSGSAALDLVYVAGGRLDLYYDHGLSPWDLAAGALMVSEAGGKVTEIKGGSNIVYGGSVIAGNALLHTGFSQLIAGGKKAAAE